MNFKMTHYHWSWFSIRSSFTLCSRGALPRVKKQHKSATFIHSLEQLKRATNWPCQLTFLALQGKGTGSARYDQAKSISHLKNGNSGNSTITSCIKRFYKGQTSTLRRMQTWCFKREPFVIRSDKMQTPKTALLSFLAGSLTLSTCLMSYVFVFQSPTDGTLKFIKKPKLSLCS